MRGGGPGRFEWTGEPGELVQSLTWRESFGPAQRWPAAETPVRGLLTDAPSRLRVAVAVGWAVLHLVAAGACCAVVVVVLIRVLEVLA
jgi:hypothetical protein